MTKRDDEFEEIKKKQLENVVNELLVLAKQLGDLGWSRDEVLVYLHQLLGEEQGPKED